MNDKGYLLLEVLLLIVILTLIINIFFPILNNIVKLININDSNDFENKIILNILESIKTAIKSKDDIEIYNIDVSKLITICDKETIYREDFQIYQNNKIYIVNIKKDNIGPDLWEFQLQIKENGNDGEGNEGKARIITRKPE